MGWSFVPGARSLVELRAGTSLAFACKRKRSYWVTRLLALLVLCGHAELLRGVRLGQCVSCRCGLAADGRRALGVGTGAPALVAQKDLLDHGAVEDGLERGFGELGEDPGRAIGSREVAEVSEEDAGNELPVPARSIERHEGVGGSVEERGQVALIEHVVVDAARGGVDQDLHQGRDAESQEPGGFTRRALAVPLEVLDGGADHLLLRVVRQGGVVALVDVVHDLDTSRALEERRVIRLERAESLQVGLREQQGRDDDLRVVGDVARRGAVVGLVAVRVRAGGGIHRDGKSPGTAFRDKS